MTPPSDSTPATSEGTSDPSTESSTTLIKDTESVTKAMQFLVSGKRSLLIQDVSAATTALEEACRLLGKHFGETAKECGEAYFYYGKSLLELARIESGVIDNAFDGVEEKEGDSPNDSRVGDPNDITEGEAERISEQVDDALIENCQETEKILGQKKGSEKENGDSQEKVNGHSLAEEDKEQNKESEDSKEEDEEEGDEDSQEEDTSEKKTEGEDIKEEEEEAKETESIGSNDAGTSVVKDDKDKDAVDKEEEEDPSNLQLSWELLELAKGIFQKHADSISDAKSDKRLELEAKLCDTYQLLGEVSIENENYEQAVEDLTSCLRRREEILPLDSRSIAETHYQLGVALGFNLNFDKAVSALESSIGVLETRIKNLKEKTESRDPSKKDDTFYSREKEIEEIEKLIPEIKEKIVDTGDMKEETMKKIREGGGSLEMFKEENGKSSKDKPVSNISNLVKKRKKSTDEVVNGESPKKAHLEDTESKEANGTVETSA